MTDSSLINCFEQVQQKTPLVHCITNYVTVHDVANVLIACGGAPIMSDEPEDVVDITSICGGLDVNIGTLNTRSIEAMNRSVARARELGHAIVLDPVGAGASTLRTQTAAHLVETGALTCIRGNMSELKAIAQGTSSTRGVDVAASDVTSEENLETAVDFVRNLSSRTGAVVVASGAIDLISDAGTTYIVRNGHSRMAAITGSGCMLTAVVAAYLTANPQDPTAAAAAACCMYGIAGERAARRADAEGRGNATYSNYLIDEVSLMNAQIMTDGMKIEVRR